MGGGNWSPNRMDMVFHPALWFGNLNRQPVGGHLQAVWFVWSQRDGWAWTPWRPFLGRAFVLLTANWSQFSLPSYSLNGLHYDTPVWLPEDGMPQWTNTIWNNIIPCGKKRRRCSLKKNNFSVEYMKRSFKREKVAQWFYKIVVKHLKLVFYFTLSLLFQKCVIVHCCHVSRYQKEKDTLQLNNNLLTKSQKKGNSKHKCSTGNNQAASFGERCCTSHSLHKAPLNRLVSIFSVISRYRYAEYPLQHARRVPPAKCITPALKRPDYSHVGMWVTPELLNSEMWAHVLREGKQFVFHEHNHSVCCLMVLRSVKTSSGGLHCYVHLMS